MCTVTPISMATGDRLEQERGKKGCPVRSGNGMSTDLALGRQCCYVALEVLAGPTPAVNEHNDRPFTACCFVRKLDAIIGGEVLSAWHGWMQAKLRSCAQWISGVGKVRDSDLRMEVCTGASDWTVTCCCCVLTVGTQPRG